MIYLKGLFKIFESEEEPKYHRSATGYGSKIPTRFYVKIFSDKGDRRMRRVYAICYSNVASYFIVVNRKREFIQDYKFGELLD